MRNHRQSRSAESPLAPQCAELAPLLPLVAHGLLEADRAARVRAHVATCARCRAELSEYERATAALRRYAESTAGASALLSHAEIAQLLAEGAPSRSHKATTDALAHPRSRRPRSRLLSGLPAVAAALALAVVLFGAPGVSRLFHPGGRGPTLSKNFEISSISMVSPTDGWVVGGDSISDTAPPSPALFHYDGSQWRHVGNPIGLAGVGEYIAVSMDSATDGWAIADGVLLHFTSAGWAVAPASIPGGLNGIFMRSASDGWATGSGTDGAGLLLRYDGAAWTRVTSPAFAGMALSSLTALSDTDVRVLGTPGDVGGRGASVILHYDGHTWTREPIAISNSALEAIVMVAPDDGWAVGAYCGCGANYQDNVPPRGVEAALILHYRNGMWQEVTSVHHPVAAPLFSLAMPSASEGWAVAFDSRIMHYANGAWSEVSSPSHSDGQHANPSLLTISMASPEDGWAGGNSGTLLHYSSGVWEQY